MITINFVITVRLDESSKNDFVKPTMRWITEPWNNTEVPRYNDTVCYQIFFCKIEFVVIKKLDMDLSKEWITDTFEHLLQFIRFVRIASARRF